MLRSDDDGRGQTLQDASESDCEGRSSDGGTPTPASRRARDTIALRPAAETPAVAERPARPSEAEESANKQGDEPKKRKHSRARLVALGLIALLPLTAAGYVYWDDAAHYESTDDAFIAARQFSIAPRVSGYITEVPVTDNQHVMTGDVIARIDPRDYRVSLAQAEAQVAGAQDAITNIDAQIGVQQAQVIQAQAQIEQAQAGLVFAQQQASRYQDLAQSGSGSVQNAQQYSSALRQQDAAVRTAQAALTAAQRQVDALKAQRNSAEANLGQAQAQRDQAQLNLSYTTLTAAQPGRIVNLSAGVGAYATPGASLTMFVPDDIWVVANFKETQLDAMRPNQPVTLEIDAYPGRVIKGHVASVQPGSGTAFSLLPAENATGNYVKIVQRVPVKIVLDNPPPDVALGPGMSVVPTVRVDPAPSLYERLKARL